MTQKLPDIQSLPTEAKDIRPGESVQYLQQITNVPKNGEEAQHLIDHIAAIIVKETTAECDDVEPLVNQVVLNLAFRSYYAVLERFQLPDQHFGDWPQRLRREQDFLMLYSALLTSHYRKLDAQLLRNRCQEALEQAIYSNSTALLAIVKALNLLCRKFPTLDVDMSLEHIYYLLQSQIFGIREETLTLFTHCAKDAKRAARYFLLISEFWPWTNRNKYYLLSCILSSHPLHHMLEMSQNKSTEEFFAGLRLSLNYKSLLASSQYLVKSLSGQDSVELLQLSVEILTHGSLKEIGNFHSQWFSRIIQKDALFMQLQMKPEIAEALQSSHILEESTQRYRLILIFSMFSRQIFQLSKLHFFKISTELITNCFSLESDSQLLVFKFIVDNLSNFAIEDCLEFLLCFIKTHKGVENAQYRNSILGKMATIINYVSKTYSRLDANDSSTLRGSIKSFFLELQQIIDVDISSTLYQPKIFALKLLEILLKSLYVQSPEKNAKNCSVAQNQKLGSFLIQEEVFHAKEIQEKLLLLLDDSQGFDDALELQVGLLKLLNYSDTKEAFDLCQKIVQNSDIDQSALSSLYAKVAVDSFSAAQTPAETLRLFGFCLDALSEQLPSFAKDPLMACKSQNHLFGYLETCNECVLSNPSLLQTRFKELLALLRNILEMILKMLNLSTLRASKEESNVPAAASFQDMDESLDLLVQESAFSVENREDCRKFLLMSFWLTLKACCDLATTIGCHLVPTSEKDSEHLAFLEQCLQINVCVLTKCRHKGAIEAAGVSIGKLTKCLTSQLQPETKAYQLLNVCLDLLFDKSQQISTTRRGAGFSIMFLHVVKNEDQRARPLLRRAIRYILGNLKQSFSNQTQESTSCSQNYDRLEALTLHYLCVLVKDTELREAMSKYYDEVMMAAIEQIDNPEWTICNAALQLFGALVPKIVGQKQATEFETPVAWEPTEVTFMEITLKLPKTCDYILNYCTTRKQSNGACIRSIILFFGFLAKVEHLRKSDNNDCDLLPRFRTLMWSLLAHSAEKVRKLAAICFVRSHEFRCDLPQVLEEISKVVFKVKNENFFQGLIFVLIEGTQKLQHESLHTLDKITIRSMLDELQQNLSNNFQLGNRNLYTLCKLLDLLLLLGFEMQSEVVGKLLKVDIGKSCIGYDVWQEKVAQIMQTS